MTGASGCIGHYIADLLIQQTPHDLFFFRQRSAKAEV